MKNQRRKVLVVATALVMALVIGSVAAYADVGGAAYFQQGEKAKKGYITIDTQTIMESYKYKKAFKGAKKVIIYKKAEGSKKFKKFKTVKAKKKIKDKKARGFVQYKFQPVKKNGKKGKKTMVCSAVNINRASKITAKNVDAGTVITMKIKNTSKKYAAKVTVPSKGVVYLDDTLYKKLYMTNNVGTKKLKSVTVKKGKTAAINIMVPGKKIADKVKPKNFDTFYNVTMAKKVFEYAISTEEKQDNAYIICTCPKEGSKLWSQGLGK